MAIVRAATTNSTITLNPISGILTRPDTYQTEGGERTKRGGGGGGRVENKASKMTYLTGQQASKCNPHHGAASSRELNGCP